MRKRLVVNRGLFKELRGLKPVPDYHNELSAIGRANFSGFVSLGVLFPWPLRNISDIKMIHMGLDWFFSDLWRRGFKWSRVQAQELVLRPRNIL
jgi:hypothetical protein